MQVGCEAHFLTGPKVNWTARDLDDSVAHVSAASILHDYRRLDYPICPIVYQAWFPLFVLSEHLWNERDGLSYDWRNYDVEGIYPPLKIEIFEAREACVMLEPGTAMSSIYIRDGNHRIRFFKNHGFTEAPAWVLDYRTGFYTPA